MRRGKAVLALGVLAGAAALGLGGSMAAKRQPLPLPARYDLREDGAGPWIRDQGDQNRSEERRVEKECRSRWSPYH